MHLVTVERTGGALSVRLAHPLFGEIRRATAGEMYLSSIRGRLARAAGAGRRPRHAGDGAQGAADPGVGSGTRPGAVPGSPRGSR